MGARFDKKIDNQTRYRKAVETNLLNPALSADDAKTAANEAMTHLILTGNDDDGKGMFAFDQLLGAGSATAFGMSFIEVAKEKIGKVEADVTALLNLATKPKNLEGAGGLLEAQWIELKKQLDVIFNTDSDNVDEERTSVVRMTTPREEDILGEIEDVLDALSSEDAFVAATADEKGAFSQELSASKARDTFNRLKWSDTATLGMTGSTRYGTAKRESTANAVDKAKVSQSAAFSYATMAETVRTRDAANVALTGLAEY